MKKFRRYSLALTILFFTVLSCPPKVNAQGGPQDPGCDPLDPACPVDGGVSLLILAAISLGAKKAYDQKKKYITRM